jgi:hypothetical protein
MQEQLQHLGSTKQVPIDESVIGAVLRARHFLNCEAFANAMGRLPRSIM